MHPRRWIPGVSCLIRPLSEFVTDASISERWQRLTEQIRSPARLLAVSKGHAATAVREIASLGQLDFGESRLQEALPKQAALADLALRWHFIGRLQSNKVRGVVRAFPVIHSVDSWSLAERLSRIAAEENLCPELFLQVKLRPDPSKGGWSEQGLIECWPQLKRLPSVKIVGLMTMAPRAEGMGACRQLFEECAVLAGRLDLSELSMGMSGDWREAVAAGSTWLRLGSALFGARPSVAAREL